MPITNRLYRMKTSRKLVPRDQYNKMLETARALEKLGLEWQIAYRAARSMHEAATESV